MDDNTRTSYTALATALMRSIHTRLDPRPLFDDPWGERLVPDEMKAEFTAAIEQSLEHQPGRKQQLEQITQWTGSLLDSAMRTQPTYGGVVLRTRYTEDALAEAAARGVRQYVIVGAGFDAFSIRRPSFARELEIFELDHPATQAFKRERIAALDVSLPESVHFISVDFRHEGVDDALRRSSYRSDIPAFFAWLGVTTYLPLDANWATLRAMASVAAPGSELVFTYIDAKAFDPAHMTPTMERLRAGAAALGEPWISGFDPKRLPEELQAVGWQIVEDVRNEMLLTRYERIPSDHLHTGRNGHLLRARRDT